jgi:tetratricopeptide (TPR) repeat protein
MGFFRDLLKRLFGKGVRPTADQGSTEMQRKHDKLAQEVLERARNYRPPPPRVIGDPNGDSHFIAVESEGGLAMVMDREQFDYLYGESKAPDPAQRDLDELLPNVTRVRAIAGGMYHGRTMALEVILETADPEALSAFRKALQIVDDPRTFSHCACLGGPTLELYRGQELLATVGLQHGHSVRWKKWKHDARLANGQALNDWLTRYGVEQALLDLLLHNQYDAGGMLPLGFQRRGPVPLSRAEQRVRLVELARVRGGDLEAALAECQKVLDAEPNLAFAYAVRALIHSQRGDHARCLADCTEAIRRDLREAELFFARAVALDHLGRPQEALADCTAALQIDPQHANAYHSRGLIRVHLDQPDEALKDFAQAIRLAPEWPLLYLNRAQVFHGRGQLDVALTDYDRAIDLLKKMPPSKPSHRDGPTLALVYCRRGEARYDQFREEEAEADFAEARRRDPGTTFGYLGDMWLGRKKPERALEAFSQLVRLRPQDACGYIGRGRAKGALGELDQALADFTEAIRLEPGNASGYGLRGHTYQLQGKSEKAVADYTEILQLHPDHVPTLLARAALRAQHRACLDAWGDLEKALALEPENPVVCNNLAWLLATCPEDAYRDGKRAVELARKACERTAWKMPNCLDTLAAACAETGAFADACHWQTQALARSPDSEKPIRRSRLDTYQKQQPYRDSGWAAC